MKGTIVAMVTALLFLMTTAPLQASPPQEVEGDFQVAELRPTSARQVGNENVCVINAEADFSFTGDLSGDFTADFRIVRRGPCDLTQPAPDNFVAQGTYTGSVLGAPGTFDFVFRGGVDDQGNAQGQMVVLQGSGDLSSLHGQVTLSGLAGVGGSYSGQVHFDP